METVLHPGSLAILNFVAIALGIFFGGGYLIHFGRLIQSTKVCLDSQQTTIDSLRGNIEYIENIRTTLSHMYRPEELEQVLKVRTELEVGKYKEQLQDVMTRANQEKFEHLGRLEKAEEEALQEAKRAEAVFAIAKSLIGSLDKSIASHSRLDNALTFVLDWCRTEAELPMEKLQFLDEALNAILVAPASSTADGSEATKQTTSVGLRDLFPSKFASPETVEVRSNET